MSRTRLWSAIHQKFKMIKGSLNGAGAAETAWIVAPRKNRNRRGQESNHPDVACLSESLQRCAVANSNDESTEQRRRSHAPLWMTNLVSRPPPVALDQKRQHILLLVGVPGSGKSTLTETLCRVLPWKYQQVNQDTLGHRNACLSLTQRILDDGYCPIIDRCNVSRKQREYFTDFRITDSDALIPVDCIVLGTVSIRTCVRRCKNRGPDHPTLKPNEVDRVMRFVQKEWEPPLLDREGTLRSVITVTSEEMLQNVVLKLMDSAVAESSEPIEPKEEVEEDETEDAVQ